jgi:hypothetical protein
MSSTCARSPLLYRRDLLAILYLFLFVLDKVSKWLCSSLRLRDGGQIEQQAGIHSVTKLHRSLVVVCFQRNKRKKRNTRVTFLSSSHTISNAGLLAGSPARNSVFTRSASFGEKRHTSWCSTRPLMLSAFLIIEEKRKQPPLSFIKIVLSQRLSDVSVLFIIQKSRL